MIAEDSPFEPGSPEDFAWVSANVGNVEALQRQINAAEDRILARQAAEELKTRLPADPPDVGPTCCFEGCEKCGR